MRVAFIVVYELGALATWIYLTFFNGFSYNWWNWIVALTINPFLAEIWPIYWLLIVPGTRYIIDPLFGDRHGLAALVLLFFLLAWFWLLSRRRRG